jgi:hypothetical protein
MTREETVMLNEVMRRRRHRERDPAPSESLRINWLETAHPVVPKAESKMCCLCGQAFEHPIHVQDKG